MTGAEPDAHSQAFRRPARAVVLGFAVAICVGTALLALPAARTGPHGTPLVTAMFTSTSAVCVTGLAVVDTATYWTGFGQAVILGLVQVGGFGIMTLASLLALAVSRRLGLRRRILAQVESGGIGLGEVRRILVGIVGISLAMEVITAALLFVRLHWTHGDSVGRALWHGVFLAVSAWNNAGFALYSDNLVSFVHDPLVLVPVGLAVIGGGLGFPVWLELGRERRSPATWSQHTKITLAATAVLIAGGTLAVLAFEWSNQDTFGPLHLLDKLVNAFFQAVSPRTAGFNSVDYGAMREETWLVTEVLMFIGAGSASAGGGIKVSTITVLALAVWSEVRGHPSVDAFGRRIPVTAQRQALAVTVAGLTAVVAATLALTALAPVSSSRALFEAFSAFGTAGLSTGVTGAFGVTGQLILVALMFLGRTGPLTLGAALAIRERKRRFAFPEERPIIG